jgi:hypothetical protein
MLYFEAQKKNGGGENEKITTHLPKGEQNVWGIFV